MYVAYRTDEFEDAAKARAKEILDQMTPKTRQLAMIAIKDAFDDDNAFEMNWTPPSPPRKRRNPLTTMKSMALEFGSIETF